MSGPIVRKYGFPNFDKIFGERPIQHGAEEEPEPTPAKSEEPATPSGAQPSSPPPASKTAPASPKAGKPAR